MLTSPDPENEVTTTGSPGVYKLKSKEARKCFKTCMYILSLIHDALLSLNSEVTSSFQLIVPTSIQLVLLPTPSLSPSLESSVRHPVR